MKYIYLRMALVLISLCFVVSASDDWLFIERDSDDASSKGVISVPRELKDAQEGFVGNPVSFDLSLTVTVNSNTDSNPGISVQLSSVDVTPIASPENQYLLEGEIPSATSTVSLNLTRESSPVSVGKHEYDNTQFADGTRLRSVFSMSHLNALSEESDDARGAGFLLASSIRTHSPAAYCQTCSESMGNCALCVRNLSKCCVSAPVSGGCATCCILMPFGFLYVASTASAYYACPLYTIALPLSFLGGMCGIYTCEKFCSTHCAKKREQKKNGFNV